MLGQDVVRAAGAVGYTRAQLDVTDRDAVANEIGPRDVVINCAAWTDVDGAEEHEDEALSINRDGARNVAEAAGIVLYVSSDYVFDGPKAEPYLESDPVNPLSAYGRTKLAGERATAEANPRHLIARSSWLFGVGGKNFVETMLGLGPEARVVDDQIGCPTFTGHLAEALVGSRAPRTSASTTSRRPAPARGSTSLARSSPAPAPTRASSPAPPPSSRAPLRGPPTPCSPASAATRCRPGSRASTRTSGVRVS